jgi:hypothetical protein
MLEEQTMASHKDKLDAVRRGVAKQEQDAADRRNFVWDQQRARAAANKAEGDARGAAHDAAKAKVLSDAAAADAAARKASLKQQYPEGL